MKINYTIDASYYADGLDECKFFATTYNQETAQAVMHMFNSINHNRSYNLRIVTKNTLLKVIYSGPCTILFDQNGHKTIVRCTETEKFDHEKGAMMAFLKRYLSKEQWKTFVSSYWDHPRKEKTAARALILVMFGRDVHDKLIKVADEAWERSKR